MIKSLNPKCLSTVLSFSCKIVNATPHDSLTALCDCINCKYDGGADFGLILPLYVDSLIVV